MPLDKGKRSESINKRRKGRTVRPIPNILFMPTIETYPVAINEQTPFVNHAEEIDNRRLSVARASLIQGK
jgi:hypothetical protein